MNNRLKLLIPVFVLIMVSLACTITLGAPAASGPSQDDLLKTAVVQTLAAINPATATPATPPTAVVPPTAVPLAPAAPPTETPQPCNKAAFVSETVPDGTTFNGGDNFVKSWRLQNIGTCTWNTSYRLAFYSGEQMNGSSPKYLSINVGPGGTVDFALNLKAPNSAGTHTGYWKVQDASGNNFAQVYVQIQVNTTLAPPVAAFPDLIISEFSLNPATPTMGQNVTVRVGAYNQGNAAAGPFTVRWYGLSTFANPSCSWALPSMVAHGGQILTCTYAFPSWYPIDKTTIVRIDTDNQVAESNESNNSASISPFGVKAP